jgi:hypothetical protein
MREGFRGALLDPIACQRRRARRKLSASTGTTFVCGGPTRHSAGNVGDEESLRFPSPGME